MDSLKYEKEAISDFENIENIEFSYSNQTDDFQSSEKSLYDFPRFRTSLTISGKLEISESFDELFQPNIPSCDSCDNDKFYDSEQEQWYCPRCKVETKS